MCKVRALFCHVSEVRAAVDKMYGLETGRKHDPARYLWVFTIQLFLVYVELQ